MIDLYRRLLHGFKRRHEAMNRIWRRGITRSLGIRWDSSTEIMYAPKYIKGIESTTKLSDEILIKTTDIQNYGSNLSHYFKSRFRVIINEALINRNTGDVFIYDEHSKDWKLVSDTSEWPIEHRNFYAPNPPRKEIKRLEGLYYRGHLSSGYFHKVHEDIPAILDKSPDSIVLCRNVEEQKFIKDIIKTESMVVSDKWIILESLEIITRGQDVGYLHPRNLGKLVSFAQSKESFHSTGEFLYLSRSNHRRSLKGEIELQAELSKMGYQIVDPGNLNWINQIGMFRNAKAVIAPHGGAITNLVFSDNCRLLELMPSNRINRCFEWQSYLCKHPYQVEFVDANSKLPLPRILDRAQEMIKLSRI